MTAEQLVERDTRAQGLPVHLADPDTLARVAAIIAQTRKAAGRSSVASGLEVVRRVSVESPDRV